MAIDTVKVTVNSVETTLTYNQTSGKYEGTITAPSTSSFNQPNKYYPVEVTATDIAGNSVSVDDTDSNLGNSLRLVVKETTKPIITITSPTAGAVITNNKPAITFKVNDTDSGVDVSSVVLKIDGTAVASSALQHSVSGTTHTFTYTPTTALSDGSHTITVNASDNDGNAATQKTATFKVDTVPPTLSISAPTDNLVTNNATLTVTGTTNDATSSPVTVTINGTAATVQADGSFSETITLTEGTNTITVIATDGAGKTSTVTRTVTLDTTPPTISAVSITPNPVDAGQTYVISVTVTD